MRTEHRFYPGTDMPRTKKKSGKAVVIVLLVIMAAVFIGGVVLAGLLLQDNVSHKYSVNPSLDALTKAVVELGVKDELTLPPQEMTDTVGYFMDEEVVDGHIRYRHIYFDVAEDQKNVLIIVPFQYDDIDLVLQLNASMAVKEELDGRRYFVFSVNQAKIGEVILPDFLIDKQLQGIKKSEHVTYAEGEIRVDESFLSLEVNGQKIQFEVFALSVVPEGFHMKTGSLSDFLIAVVSGLFTRETD